MSLLAQAGGGSEGPPDFGFTDNEVLDLYYVPFGEWMGQAKDWIFDELRWLLSAIEWPFVTLNDLLLYDIMAPRSWVWIVVAFFVVGSLVRNVKVGVFAGVGIGVCGILGPGYWFATLQTLAFVGVAVLLCVLIGIPLGVACGRVDAVWQVTRPVLDAMQVVHAFVYMLPFIAFFGIGNVGATIVTMAFAVPPLVRLTNLGIRQVPEDVVEASRAYGASEWRVLIDVQLPLARAAIMTGINQTLLLAMSMLGIAAIMGAQALGGKLFGAISRQSVSEAAAAGLAFYLVAIVLDRMSQPEGAESGSLLRRVRRAWAHRRDPEALVPSEDQTLSGVDGGAAIAEVSIAPLTTAERRPMLLASAGGLVAAVSVFLTWSSGAGFLSAYGRRADEELAGESFIGLSASGGSWFGYLTLVFGLLVVASVATALVAPGRGPRWFAADGSVIASLALLVMMVAYLLASPSDLAVGQSTGIGPWAALLGAMAASAGSVWWIRLAPHTPTRPLSARVRRGSVIGAGFAVVVLGVGAFSAWSFDERGDDRIIVDGVSGAGAGLGIWVFLAGLAGLAAALPAAGLFGRHEHRQWRWSAITAGIGVGAASIGAGWIFTHVRSADLFYVSGVGSFLALAGGLVLVATAAAVLKEFRRAKVYGDEAQAPVPV